jgi:hypothetical protein
MITAELDGLVAHLQRHGDEAFSKAVDYVCREQGIEVHGTFSVDILDNVVLDAHLSEAASRLGCCIFSDDRLELCPLDETEALLVYGYDGARALAGLPLAKRLSEDGYAQPHWLPTVVKIRKEDP